MPRTWRSSAPREIGDRGRQEEIMSGDQRCQGTIFYVYVDKYCYFFASTELQDSTLGILKSGPTVVLLYSWPIRMSKCPPVNHVNQNSR